MLLHLMQIQKSKNNERCKTICAFLSVNSAATVSPVNTTDLFGCHSCVSGPSRGPGVVCHLPCKHLAQQRAAREENEWSSGKPGSEDDDSQSGQLQLAMHCISTATGCLLYRVLAKKHGRDN